MSFHDVVLRWLQERKPDLQATGVLSVSADSSDWEGDTESGFYSTFALEIVYQWKVESNENGFKRNYYVSGEEMEDLWVYVTRAWPDD